MITILTHISRVRSILALLLFLSSASLWAQSDDATLINITTLAQLDAIHYDLDGDGTPSGSTAEQTAYRTAFGLTGTNNNTCTGGCEGYELRNNLDFDNVSGSPSIWSENCTDGACQTATAVDGDNADKVGWAPIGDNSNTYTATLDGRGHTISNLYINRPSTSNVGLFGYLGGGNVRNLGIEGGSLSGSSWVGGLVGQNNGTIRACYSTGDASGSSWVGGLVGTNNFNGTISACYATGNASGASNVGGLVGNNNFGTISACSATGDASGSGAVGGLVGANFFGTISACYATGDATGTGDNVGGLVGNNSGTITNSYFDSSVSNRPALDSYSKTTTELQTPTAYGTSTDIYANWNIDVDDGLDVGVDDGTMPGDAAADDPWDFGTDSEYPALKVDFNVDGAPSVAEFGTRPRTVFRVSIFTPERGVVGATVTIRGRLFSTTAADNTVVFLGAEGDADNAVATVSTSPAPTTAELIVTVPPNAQTGPISVMVGTAADTSSQDFTVLIGEDKDANDNGLIEVSSLEQLDAIRYDLDGDGTPSGTTAEQAAYRTAFGLSGAAASCTGGCEGYELINNLDFEDANGDGTADDKSIWAEGASTAGVSGAVAEGWAPIGGSFTATFEGMGHTISNLYIDRSSTDNVGLFGALGTGGNVRNLGIEGGSLSGNNRVGGLAGENNGGTIRACYATVNVTASRNDVGGLVGVNEGGAIRACYATGNATGSGVTAGGLVGVNEGGAIRACYATGNATGTANNVGGLVGTNGSSGTIRACYATGTATGTGNSVGGLVGSGSGAVTNSYFDSSVSNRPASDSYSKTTTELQTPTAYGTGTDIYANWNIDVDNGQPIGVDDGTAAGDPTADDPWDFGTSGQYPALKVDFNVDGAPSAAEFGTQPRTVSLKVSSFTPERGVVGATVTIRGRAFGATATDNTVVFLGAAADADNRSAIVSAATATSLTVSVPTAAQTGPISVMVGAVADTSSQDYTVLIGEDKDENDNGLIEVSSLEQLDAIRYDLDGDGVPSGTNLEQAAYRTAFGVSGAATVVSCPNCKGYELMSNLDFEDANGDGAADDKSIWAEGATAAGVSDAVAEGWAPIGGSFTATFDGNNYAISNLYIDRSSTDNIGLFRTLGTGGNVRNLGIEGGSLSGNNRVGGLAGENNRGTIRACYATVNVTASRNDVGGLVGVNAGGEIRVCYATGTVTGTANNVGGLAGSNSGTISACYATGDASGSRWVGGLVGNHLSGTISACYATGDASGSSYYVGGLVGQNSGTISACYATRDASGRGGVGGLVGHNFNGTISACYATGDASGSDPVGGLVGYNFNGTVTNSYFDTETSSQTDAIGGGTTTGSNITNVFGKTTTELQTPVAYAGIYANWNIDVDNGQPIGVEDGTAAGDAAADDPWDFGTDGEYPALRVDFNVDGTPSVAEFGTQPRTAFRVSSFTPERGIVGETVTIRGRLFSTTAGENTVTFLGDINDDDDNVVATVSAATASSLTVTVPVDAMTGRIQVAVSGVMASSTTDFTVLIFPPDTDADGLVDITTLAQLDAIRYDLDGDGRPTSAGQTAWQTAFSAIVTVDDDAAAPDASTGFTGYELRNNLDFDNVGGSPSIWSENCTDGACQTATAVDGDNADKVGWEPIGYYNSSSDYASYTATFDGRGHTISNLYINRSSTNLVGLFGYLDIGSNLRNLGIEGGSVTGGDYVGGLVGSNSTGTISACYATGDASGRQSVGGLVGSNSTGTISACYATGNATGTANSVGGLVGANGGTIIACYATGNASGTLLYVGGLVGAASDDSTISACYSTGDASGRGGVGGLVGYNLGSTVTNSYFDSDVSNRPVADSYSKTTTDLQTPTAYGTAMDIYANWNIDVDNAQPIGVDDGTAEGDATADDPWDFGTNSQYPVLRVDFNVNGTPTAFEFGGQGRAVPATVPAAPSALTATAADAAVTLSWIAAASDGAPITGYMIDYSVMAGFSSPTTATTAAAATSHTVSGLTNGTLYYFRVAAVNSVGTGAYYPGATDAAVTATPAPEVPAAPSALTAMAGNAEVTLSWTAPVKDGGAAITGYMIDHSVMADFSSPTTVSTAAATSHTVSTLTNGTLYYFRVAAVNSVGRGAYYPGATDAAVTATPATVPAAPSALMATAADAAVTLSWTAAASDGGAPITGYMVEYDTDMNFLSPTPETAAATSHTVSGLTNATPYYFRVAAVNAAGTGAYYPGATDAAVTATPVAAPVVSSFTPEMGAVGEAVMITGTGFSTTAAENTVVFLGAEGDADNAAATVSAATAASLTVSVPSTAQTGKISVMVGTSADTSDASFTVTGTTPAAPVVSSFSPSEGAVDTEVTITGVNFSATPSANEVRFGGVMAADPTSASTTSLTVAVPSGAVTGRVSVTVGGQTATSSTDFTVPGTTPAPAAPVVSSFSPTEGEVDTEVTITGDNFSATASENDVRFGGVMAAEPTSASTTSLTILVPSGARTGRVSVAVGGQTGTSSENFTVTGTTPEPAAFSVPLSSEGDVRLYPNPTSGYLHFKGLLAGGRYVCDLYSLVGQKVLSSVVRAGDMMDTSTLSSSQYILILQAEGRELMRTRLLVVR